jgi:hypothetical protein
MDGRTFSWEGSRPAPGSNRAGCAADVQSFPVKALPERQLLEALVTRTTLRGAHQSDDLVPGATGAQ